MTEEKLCDQRRDFILPCPKCGAFQTLRFEQVKWPDDLLRDDHYPIRVRDSAWYECEHCQQVITDLEKPAMLTAGIWTPDKQIDHPRSVAFRVNGLYSPWIRFGDMAAEFVRSKDYYEKLMNWRNGWAGEPMVQVVRDNEVEGVLAARKEELEPDTVPKNVIALTAGIDVQKDHFWFAVRAWERDMTSYLIRYGHLPGWAELEDLLFNTEFGGFRIWRALIDTGGSKNHDQEQSRTEETYWWLRKNSRGRGCVVYGAKGSSVPLPSLLKLSKPMDKTPSGKPMPGGLQIVFIDGLKAKDSFFWHLDKAEAGEDGAAYLHRGVGDDYAKQLTAEVKRRDRKGNEFYHQLRRDNHMLDCEVLALCAASPELFGGIRLLRTANPAVTPRPAPAPTSENPFLRTSSGGINPYTANLKGRSPYGRR